jgi:predicted metal-dependent HD superfamily phosphohydrolase
MLVAVMDLVQAWRNALPPSASQAAAIRAGTDLIARWSEPQRFYHTADHLTAVLAIIDEFGGWAADPDAVRLAAWFHDAVYDPRRLDNEEASGLLAEAVLPGLGVVPAQVSEVARLVRLTASHDPLPGDRNGGLLMDADLSILASPPAPYQAYVAAVRREYDYLDDGVFAAGRAGVLNNLLSLSRLFHTPALRDRWEDLARQNIASELAAIRGHLGRTGSADLTAAE